MGSTRESDRQFLRQLQQSGQFDRWAEEAGRTVWDDAERSVVLQTLAECERQLEESEFGHGLTPSGVREAAAQRLWDLLKESGQMEDIHSRVAGLLFSDNEFSHRLETEISALRHSLAAAPSETEANRGPTDTTADNTSLRSNGSPMC